MSKPKPLSENQAQAEAHRRWGKRGMVWHPPYECKGGECYCIVGVTDGTTSLNRWTPYGVGPSYEAAFQDALERGY